jgi:hypothetical protein
MNLSVTSPLYVKLGVGVFAVLLLWLGGLPAFVSVANYMLDTGKVLLGVAIISITGNAQSIANTAAEVKARADATVEAAK